MRSLLLPIALALAGCHSTAVEEVKSLASSDWACPQDKIQVTPTKEEGCRLGGGETPCTYAADGCGKKATYECQGWDSYSQKPLCRSR